MADRRRDLGHLLDLRDIADLLHRYARALDDKDWSLLATCFTTDAVALYGEVLGRQEGFAAIEKVCRAALGHLDSSQHIIANPEIAIDGDTATARCYVHAQHTKAGTPGGDNMTIGGTYLDRLVRTAEGWRICERELRFLWQEGNQAVLGG
jgi:ketosteroid isomerase-like protein